MLHRDQSQCLWVDHCDTRLDLMPELKELDLKGLVCPEPLLRVRNRIRELDPGDLLRVEATDSTTKRDFSNFCHHMRHRLEECREQDGVIYFRIRKG